jgi:hypothetical protein
VHHHALTLTRLLETFSTVGKLSGAVLAPRPATIAPTLFYAVPLGRSNESQPLIEAG